MEETSRSQSEWEQIEVENVVFNRAFITKRYSGIKITVFHRPPLSDSRLPSIAPSKYVMVEPTWDEICLHIPYTQEWRKTEALKLAVQRVDCEADDSRTGDDALLKQDGLQCIVELAVEKAHHQLVTASVLRAVAFSVSHPHVDVARTACWAGWLLGSTASCRRGLISYGIVENVVKHLRAEALSSSRPNDPNVDIFEEACLAVLFVCFLDQPAREAYFEMEPDASTLHVLATTDPTDCTSHPYWLQRRQHRAAEVLGSALVRDPSDRQSFFTSGGFGKLDALISSKNERVSLCGAVLLSLAGMSADRQALLPEQASELFEISVMKLRDIFAMQKQSEVEGHELAPHQVQLRDSLASAVWSAAAALSDHEMLHVSDTGVEVFFECCMATASGGGPAVCRSLAGAFGALTRNERHARSLCGLSIRRSSIGAFVTSAEGPGENVSMRALQALLQCGASNDEMYNPSRTLALGAAYNLAYHPSMEGMEDLMSGAFRQLLIDCGIREEIYNVMLKCKVSESHSMIHLLSAACTMFLSTCTEQSKDASVLDWHLKSLIRIENLNAVTYLAATTWLLLRNDSCRSYVEDLRKDYFKELLHTTFTVEDDHSAILAVLSHHLTRAVDASRDDWSCTQAVEFLIGSLWILFNKDDAYGTLNPQVCAFDESAYWALPPHEPHVPPLDSQGESIVKIGQAVVDVIAMNEPSLANAIQLATSFGWSVAARALVLEHGLKDRGICPALQQVAMNEHMPIDNRSIAAGALQHFNERGMAEAKKLVEIAKSFLGHSGSKTTRLEALGCRLLGRLTAQGHMKKEIVDFGLVQHLLALVPEVDGSTHRISDHTTDASHNALHVLLNLTTIQSGQRAVAKLGLRKLIDLCKKSATYSMTTTCILHNLSRCGANRTLLYKEELREKLQHISSETHGFDSAAIHHALRESVETTWSASLQKASQDGSGVVTSSSGPRHGSDRWDVDLVKFEQAGDEEAFGGVASELLSAVPSNTAFEQLRAASEASEEGTRAKQPDGTFTMDELNQLSPEERNWPVAVLRANEQPGKSVDLNLRLQNEHPRNMVTFKESVQLAGIPRVAVFEHFDGSRVYDGLFPVYTLPNGRKAHVYDSGIDIVEESPFGLESPPRRPLTLIALLQDSLPTAGINSLHEPSDCLPSYQPKPPRAPIPREGKLPWNEAFRTLKENNPALTISHEVVEKDEVEEVRQGVDVPPPEAVKEPWDIYKSIFAPRLREADSRYFYETEDSWLRMFRKDWERCRSQERLASTIARESKKDSERRDGKDPVNKQGEVLWPMYKQLMLAYRFYSLCGSEWFLMALNEYMEFLNTCGIDIAVHFLKCFARRSDCDRVFITATFQEDKSRSGTTVTENSLMRFDFLEIIIRLGIAKYGYGQATYTVSEAVQMLFDRNIAPNLPPEACVDSDEFRNERLYNEDVDKVLKNNKDALRAVYSRYRLRPPGGGLRPKLMQKDGWMQLMHDACVIGEHFTERAAKMCYCEAKMNVIDEVNKRPKIMSLQWVEFLEALGRVSDRVHLPTQQQVNESSFRDRGVLAFMLDQENQDPAHRILRRNSNTSLRADKTRPLAEKLDVLLEYIFQRLDYNPAQPRAFDKARFIRSIMQQDKQMGS